MKTKIIGKKILLQREASETHKGGILLPEQAKEDNQKCTVIQIGTGYKDSPLSVGDRVYVRYGMGTITIEGEKYILAQEEDILAILNYD